jgi:nitroreductase
MRLLMHGWMTSLPFGRKHTQSQHRTPSGTPPCSQPAICKDTPMPKANPAALSFLQNRRSRPAKTMAHPVPSRAEVTEILTAAVRVPDHGKLEPWRFVVIQGAAMARLANLAEDRAKALGYDAEKTAKGRGQFDLGLLAVVVISSPKPSEKIPQIEQVLSAGAVCLGILNAAEAAGWGANWLTGWPSYDRGFIEAAFGLQPQETITGIVHIATETNLGPDRPRPDLTRLVDWQTA